MAISFLSTFKPIAFFPTQKSSPTPPLSRCNLSLPTVTITEPEPVFTSVKTFAPATVANLGPGFDFLGCAVDGLGDHVSVTVDPSVHPGEISITEIYGTHASSKLSKNPIWNCAGIAAIAAMKMLNIRSVGLSLSLEKGLPLGSGLGSSAASAAAAAVAVNELFGGKLDSRELVLAGLESEAKVSGYHADNIAPAIMGGFVLIRSYDPLELMRLEFPADKELLFVLPGGSAGGVDFGRGSGRAGEGSVVGQDRGAEEGSPDSGDGSCEEGGFGGWGVRVYDQRCRADGGGGGRWGRKRGRGREEYGGGFPERRELGISCYGKAAGQGRCQGCE
ncbi:unnamed protein product [Linum tenue]|uniref:GHMP kinase N-terminal domain-containing protein n=1 Tax=Linum tenue TaxID=586396 RepID=A0AAV0MUD8_9ROSI|nr:unnamed protein product [Linum tenue]